MRDKRKRSSSITRAGRDLKGALFNYFKVRQKSGLNSIIEENLRNP